MKIGSAVDSIFHKIYLNFIINRIKKIESFSSIFSRGYQIADLVSNFINNGDGGRLQNNLTNPYESIGVKSK